MATAPYRPFWYPSGLGWPKSRLNFLSRCLILLFITMEPIEPPKPNLGFKGKKAGVFADGSYVPIFQVPPVYPRRALERGIEGCVMLKFTVTKVGSTKEPEVEWSVPPGIFDRAAMRSALKYKYKPQIRDGEAIEVPNVRTIIVFKIEDPNKPAHYVPEGCA